MHPLLSPTSPSELAVLAEEFKLAGYYDNDQDAFLKMYLGVTLGLTALESLHGLTVTGKQVVLKTPLVERVIKRTAGCGYTARPSGTAITLSFTIAGRKMGDVTMDQAEYNPPVTLDTLHDLALSKGARMYFPDLFGHKFSTELELSVQGVSVGGTTTTVSEKVEAVKQQVPGLTTADQIEPKAKNPTKLELAENSQKLIDWQNRVEGLSSEFPGDWDEHAQKLQELKFLPEAEFLSIWEKYKKHATTKGIGYNSVTRKFYKLNYTPHTAFQKETA